MNTYSDYLRRFFPEEKIQKISIDAGFTCPNRNGVLSKGGCIYCRNDSFTPGYCDNRLRVSRQLEKGKEFFSRKYQSMKYLAYFQAFTGTYSHDLDYLRSLYHEALSVKDVVGIVIGTRPDMIPDNVISLLREINHRHPVFLEIGAETSNDETLRLINRNHTWEDVKSAVGRASAAGLHCGLHLIAGLPGEDEDSFMETIDKTIDLPIETLKIHQLQILLGTTLYELWQSGKIRVEPFTLERYLRLCARIIERVPERILIERFLSQSPPEMVAAPKWNLKNYQFIHLLEKFIKEQNKSRKNKEPKCDLG